jgi:LAO/AO transport system kinase
MATRGSLGGVAAATRDAITVLAAAGKEWIIVETVGVGQDEIVVAQLADVTVLVLTPGAGDDVQTMKAGIMEIADIFALNKADNPAIDQLEANVRESFALREAAVGMAHEQAGEQVAALPPIIKTVATEGRGVPQLRIAIEHAASAVRTRAGRHAAKQALGGVALGEDVALDHLGIAVPELASSLKFYEELLGLRLAGTYFIPQERTRVAMLPAGDARIELLEPTEADSPIGKFLAKRGPGLHHICLRVPDLAAAIARLKQSGARLLNDTPQTGAGGHQYVFVHPSSAGGVLLELVQAGSGH